MERRWFVTGASKGIGRALVEHLVRSGQRVVGIARSTGSLEALVAASHGRLQCVAVDVTDTQALRQAVDEAVTSLGGIDVVVSCAGYVLVGAAEEYSDEQIEREIATNLLASIHLIRAFLPHLRAAGGGRIIQISSEGGQMVYPGLSIYHATKWGIEGFCEALALEVAPAGIRVTLIEPGRVATDLHASAQVQELQHEAYRKGPIGMYLRLEAMGRFPQIGDPVKLAAAIAGVADDPSPPLRLTLGSDGYRNVHRALSRRLELLNTQESIAGLTDYSDD